MVDTLLHKAWRVLYSRHWTTTFNMDVNYIDQDINSVYVTDL